MKETITVKKGGFLNKYRTIQQGINDVDEGGTVYIESGVYQERIILDGKNVTLVGQGNVTVTGEIDYPLITTIDTTLSLKGLTFIQKGHTNAVYIKENSKVKIDSCTIEGEDHKDVKTTYPALWVGLDSVVFIQDSTLIGHTSNSIHLQESTMQLENCTIKGFGIYVYQKAKLTTNGLKISHPSSYGVFAKEGHFEMRDTRMTGGGVAAILEDGKGAIHGITTNHTYRDVFRVDHSELTVTDADIQHFCEIKDVDEKANYPAVFVKNNSTVTLEKVNIHDSKLDAIQVYQSRLKISDSQISNVYMGIFIREQAKVTLDKVHISQTVFNALSIAGNAEVTVKDSHFDECVIGKHDKNYPVVIMREQGSLHVEGTTISNSANDAIYMAELQNAVLKDMTIDATDVGIYVEKTPLSVENITIKNCLKNAAFFVQSPVTITNSHIESNNLLSKPEYELDSEIPKRVDASVSIINARVSATNLTISDKTASISLQKQSRFQGNSLRLSGGVFNMESDFQAEHLMFINLEKEPIHFKLLLHATANVQFDNPNDSISYVKDLTSKLESNLLKPAHAIVQHDFTANTNPAVKPVPPLPETNPAPPTELPPQASYSLAGPTAYKETMQRLLKQASLYQVRLSQGITLPHNWSMLWIEKGITDVIEYVAQTKQAFYESNLISEDNTYRLSETDPSLYLETAKNGLLWIDQLEKVWSDTAFLTEITRIVEERAIIFTGTEEEVHALAQNAPELYAKIGHQVIFDDFTATDTAAIIQSKLTDLQFVFDTAFLKQAVMDNFPAKSQAGWPEEVIQAIIQSQSDRLLAEPDQQLVKDQIVTLTQADIYKGILATIK